MILCYNNYVPFSQFSSLIKLPITPKVTALSNLILCLFMNAPCRTLGTPNEVTWPGVEQLKEFKKDFPKWKTQNLHTIIPQLDEEGVELLEVHLK